MSKFIQTVLLALAIGTPVVSEASMSKITDLTVSSKTDTNTKKKVKKKKQDVIKDDAGKSSNIIVGKASWYGKKFVGRKTASGERLTEHLLTAAHKKLPLGTIIKVVNTANNQSVIVKINDRGPYVGKRILDLSPAAAKKIGMTDAGVVTVSMIIISKPKTI